MRIFTRFAALMAAILVAISCASTGQDVTLSGLKFSDFDTVVNGKPISLYRVQNERGMEVCVTNYGARIVSVMVPDRDGKMCDVVLGFDNIADYLANTIPFGATIGRNTNRIRGAKYSVDGVEYKLDANDNGHSTHGGPDGWQGKIFSVEEVTSNSITLRYFSPDGESGFTGDVDARVTYSLDEMNSININYHATTSAPTVVNLTNHSYFALTGDPSQSMMSCSIMVKSDYYAPKAADNVPRGDLKSVDGTPLDFRSMTDLEQCLRDHGDYDEIVMSNGFGVSMLLRNEAGDEGADVVVSSPVSGIVMEIFSSQECLQFFSCNDYDKSYTGKGGVAYKPRNAFCLETQHIPNAVNVDEWESPIVRPGEVYEHYCIYRFSVEGR